MLAGLYSGSSAGAGAFGATFILDADGNRLVDQSFSTMAAATSYFADHPVDLGSLAGEGRSARMC